MCGICGIHTGGSEAVPRDDLRAMREALHHRGPDGAGDYVGGETGLAMRRLSIIDLAGGDQPIYNEDETVCVVQNGEIYNYRELKAELIARGHTFRTESDTEVLVHLYEEHGERFAAHLRGMFAVAVWDQPRRRLVVARDPFGIKPLYYARSGDSLAFSSELRSLMCWEGFSREIDFDALAAYLTFNWIPAPATIFRGARKLPAGCVLVCEGSDVRISRYERVGAVPGAAAAGESEEERVEALREVLKDSVRAHLVADVPVGVLLSGGIDSSVLVALAAELSDEPVKTFSIGFDVARFNELDKARSVARQFGTDHHELVVRPDAVEMLPRIARTYDEPFGDSSALPTYLVSELASSHVKVALAGEGGDELFGGYFTYIGHSLPSLAGRAAAAGWPLIRRLPSTGPRRYMRYEDKAKRFARGAALPPLERHCAWQEVIGADVRNELLNGSHPNGGDVLRAHRERFAETEGAEPLARFQDLDVGTYLVDGLLVKSDRASMANSLEMRVPFLDRAVSRFAFSLSDRDKVQGRETKRLLRKTAATLVPPEILNAPKQGFSIPAADWLRGELAPYARDLLSEGRLSSQGLVEAAPARRLLDAHVSGRTDNSRQLWGLLMLAEWAESVGL